MGKSLETELREVASKAGAPMTINRAGSMLTAFFTGEPVTNWVSAKKSDAERYGRFFRAMLEEGVYLAPSQFECAFLSVAHTEEMISKTVEAARKAITRV